MTHFLLSRFHRLDLDPSDLIPLRRNNALIEQLSVPKDGAEPEKFDSEYARPFSVQFVALMKRALNEYWRNPG